VEEGCSDDAFPFWLELYLESYRIAPTFDRSSSLDRQHIHTHRINAPTAHEVVCSRHHPLHIAITMSAQPEDHQMEGVEQPAVADKGKGKATETVEESADDDSSDESGPEGEVRCNSIPSRRAYS
jgi:hypothetical protein